MRALGAAPVQVEGQRLSWVGMVLTVLAITSSSLSVLSLYHMLALHAEVEVLKSEVSRRREGCRDTPVESMKGPLHQQREDDANTAPLETEASGRQQEQFRLKKRSLGTLQPFLQMMPDSKRATFQKDFAMEKHTGIPWQAGLQRGEALELDQDVIMVKEEGYYFIYSQVYFQDPHYAMGNIMIRMKKHVVGDESQHVVLFRCIQTMNVKVPYNTCYTGGIVKLDVGDTVELLIPRPTASIFLDGDCTYMGAIKLA
ncbi:tumor necrosis factor ligand superfamily member 13B [Tachysurus fulvidraco]|uniref:tumor necrosis factor ligand superfamily member 13B n=1 Tax=Tachysurus fulvidraco TaxID=1234273 RepID=UPI000F4DE3BB|nr:tumor necrosis factor ligand superfamily member 13B [Tachysurus fulvidraco]XP_027020388.1 tumor necrosis factor ligand superfamily member 13B [Tachysurus fulvidraco]XP_047671089.1 tumor necrosis factor ligand superfamily member 13B [Tachysurus fulvidraco]